jgi:predicted N-acetyltransferase YhbS
MFGSGSGSSTVTAIVTESLVSRETGLASISKSCQRSVRPGKSTSRAKYWLARVSGRSYRRRVLIREERVEDLPQVGDIHRRAFGDRGSSVAALVEDLRASLGSEQGLSLVASDGDHLLGHVLFTRSMLDTPRQLVDVQVLSPVGVLPERQRQGVGSALIRCGLDELNERDVPLVFLPTTQDSASCPAMTTTSADRPCASRRRPSRFTCSTHSNRG